MKKIPTWGWLAIAGAGVLGYLWWRNKQNAAAGTTSTTGAAAAYTVPTGSYDTTPYVPDLSSLFAGLNSGGVANTTPSAGSSGGMTTTDLGTAVANNSVLQANAALFGPADVGIHTLGTGIGNPAGGGYGQTPYPASPTSGYVAGGGTQAGDYFQGSSGLANAISSLLGQGLKAGTYWSPSTYASLSEVANNPSAYSPAQVASAQKSLTTGASSTAAIPTVYATAYPSGVAPQQYTQSTL
jgi:hypothetical protein